MDFCVTLQSRVRQGVVFHQGGVLKPQAPGERQALASGMVGLHPCLLTDESSQDARSPCL